MRTDFVDAFTLFVDKKCNCFVTLAEQIEIQDKGVNLILATRYKRQNFYDTMGLLPVIKDLI